MNAQMCFSTFVEHRPEVRMLYKGGTHIIYAQIGQIEKEVTTNEIRPVAGQYK